MSYYRYHVFFCTNQREDGSQCCGQCGAQALRDYLKRRTKELGHRRPGRACGSTPPAVSTAARRVR